LSTASPGFCSTRRAVSSIRRWPPAANASSYTRMSRWSWWLTSEAGLIARIAVGAGIFVALATIDLVRNGSRATRWREYAFLLAATAFAMLYGMANDRIAVGISWEYFYYGKGLSDQLGPTVPPDTAAIHRAAVGVGLRATWTVGLLIGAILLIANNPRLNRRQVSYRILLGMLPLIGVVATFGAGVGGFVGSHGWLNWTNAGLSEIWRDNEFRPTQFLAVYGINLGGYVGGAIGTIIAVFKVWKRRVHVSRS
jgi:hypothetical protein